VSRRGAAARGAAIAALWASALLAFLAAVRTTPYAAGRHFVLSVVLFDSTALLDTAPVLVAIIAVATAALVGAILGVFAERLTGSGTARAAVLAVASLPALYVVVALSWIIIWLPYAPEHDLRDTLLMLVWSLVTAAVGMVMVLRVAVIPAVLAALMLEGWTRPAREGQGGLARPGVRRWVLHVLVAVTAALTTFAFLRWPKT
jgi:hypothetical protein